MSSKDLMIKTFDKSSMNEAQQNAIRNVKLGPILLENENEAYQFGGPVWPPKSHPTFHSIFEGILAPKMVPKASQNGAKIDPKSIIFPSSFSCCFFFSC